MLVPVLRAGRGLAQPTRKGKSSIGGQVEAALLQRVPATSGVEPSARAVGEEERSASGCFVACWFRVVGSVLGTLHVDFQPNNYTLL